MMLGYPDFGWPLLLLVASILPCAIMTIPEQRTALQIKRVPLSEKSEHHRREGSWSAAIVGGRAFELPESVTTLKLRPQGGTQCT
ncbi:hypothetical protein EXIGLDRAFT_717348 [Exidia glandulosa HHB12029]|uniref:Uncharacterized protein n=1 Tax=Exidia glandulosa HHB12029 TaxID=1314781 RepID=A0A165IGK0_EXIGL|nr:hypothetical protein EXIGLDRAFT_717348 [Exidia glandulosa HHB12029]